MRRSCCICLTPVSDDSPILTMGAYGTPKCLCDDCAAHIENMTRGREYDSIVESMDAITDKMNKSNVDDKVTVTTVTDMLVSSAKRAQEIKSGVYDFALDEIEEEDYEIPEDMKQTAEERALEEEERRSNEKFDKIMNWVWAAVIVAVLGFTVWWIFF